MSIFIIKIIACITMIFDHIKYAIPETKCFVTMYLGRMAYPAFAFLLVEGYCHTSNLKKYYKRLFIFALVSQIPFMLFRTLVGEWKMLNIMFTLLFGLATLTVFDMFGKRYYISIPIICTITFLGKLVNVDYSWFGILTVFIFYLFRNKKFLRIFGFAILALIFYWKRLIINYTTQNLLSYVFTISPTILLLVYNGKLDMQFLSYNL